MIITYLIINISHLGIKRDTCPEKSRFECTCSYLRMCSKYFDIYISHFKNLITNYRKGGNNNKQIKIK